MTLAQVRRVLKTVGQVLARAAPIILAIAIADALAGRPSNRKPPQ